MIALGTMTWRREADKAEARKMYDLAREKGVTWFDTAALYSDGVAEQWLGEFSKGDGDVKVSTKVGYRGEDPKDQLAQCVDRLGRTADVVFHHHWMKHGTWQALTSLSRCRELGLTKDIGLSNCAAWQAALASTSVRIDAIQVLYNLVKRQAEVELLPLAQHQGWRVFAYSPLASGLLVASKPKRLAEDSRYRDRYCRAKVPFRMHPRHAINWVEDHPSKPIAIVGARSVDQLASSLNDIVRHPKSFLNRYFPAPPLATDRTEEHADFHHVRRQAAPVERPRSQANGRDSRQADCPPNA